MRRETLKILPLAAAGALWTALAAVPATGQMVEKQTTGSSSASSGSSSSSSSARSSSGRSSSSRSSARSSGRTSSGSSSARSSSGRSSSSRATRTSPNTSSRGDYRGGRGHGEFRDSRRSHHVDRGERGRTEPRYRNRDRDRHRDRHPHYRYPSRYSWDFYGYSRPYRHHYPLVSYYGAFGFWYPSFLDYGWGYRGRYHRLPVTVYVNDYDNGRVGALDLDVSPEKAEIFINGNYVGVADEYDGFPTFLWLEEGTYDVAIYRPGYRTIFRQYTIYPGVVIDVEDRMQKGESIHPDDHGPKSTVNRDERIRRNREREAAVREREEEEVAAAAERSSHGQDNIGRLVLEIYPPDAAVYLDGIFLGTAGEVTGLTAGLVVDPGDHLLEVARPGYHPREVEISLTGGERVDLAVELERE